MTEETCLLRAPPAVRSAVQPSPMVTAASAIAEEADHTSMDVGESFEEAPLTLESVAAWLAVQDRGTRETCAAILAEDIELVLEKARAEGQRQGVEAARRDADDAVERSSKVLERLIVAAEASFASECAALADSCADIVGEAIAKIAGPMLGTKAAAIGAVEQVLQRVKEARDLIIRVHADDVETIRGAEIRLAGVLAGRKLQVVADARIELGGCIVESSLGGLDGRFEVQLRELFDLLRAVKGPGEPV